MIYLVALILLVATVASFTRLVHEDVIAAPWREKLRKNQDGYGRIRRTFVEAVDTCFRCAAVWVSPLPTAVALSIWGYSADLAWGWWAVLAALWIPVSKGISYLAFILYIRGEA